MAFKIDLLNKPPAVWLLICVTVKRLHVVDRCVESLQDHRQQAYHPQYRSWYLYYLHMFAEVMDKHFTRRFPTKLSLLIPKPILRQTEGAFTKEEDFFVSCGTETRFWILIALLEHTPGYCLCQHTFKTHAIRIVRERNILAFTSASRRKTRKKSASCCRFHQDCFSTGTDKPLLSYILLLKKCVQLPAFHLTGFMSIHIKTS